MKVRSVGVGRVGVCMLCVTDNEESERGVGPGVNITKVSKTLQIVGVSETVTRTFRFRKKKHELVSSNSEEHIFATDRYVYYETINREVNKRLIYKVSV